MKNQLRAILFGVTISLAAANVGHAMSELIGISEQPVWPTSPTPDGSVVYSITTVGRGGAGLLEVTLSAGDLPPGVTVTFDPPVLRFTGNEVTIQVATMTVFCSSPIPLDSYPFTLTGTAQRESITVTNEVLFSPEALATRVPTLMLDMLTGNSLRIRGAGATGITYDIEVSSSLTNPAWTTLGSATADGNGRFTFPTTVAADVPTRFFRAVTPTTPVAAK